MAVLKPVEQLPGFPSLPHIPTANFSQDCTYGHALVTWRKQVLPSDSVTPFLLHTAMSRLTAVPGFFSLQSV